MTNEKVNLTITAHEDKTSQGGKDYTRFKTNLGWMSAFDKELIDSLKANEQKLIAVEIKKDAEKGFTNIRGFIGVTSNKENDGFEETADLRPEPIKVPARAPQMVQDDGKATMWASYAKDIFVAMINNLPEGVIKNPTDLMTISINLIKQTQVAFK